MMLLFASAFTAAAAWDSYFTPSSQCFSLQDCEAKHVDVGYM